MDFSIFYKEEYVNGEISSLPKYDLFLSAYDNCDRTIEIFEKIKAKEKLWIIFPQHNIKDKLTQGLNYYSNDNYKEDEFFLDLFSNWSYDLDTKICIDITGFIRPHILYLIRFIALKGYKIVDFLYTEPIQYKKADETTFSGFIDYIRIVEGYSPNLINPNTESDILIINAGYDDNLIAKISQDKNHCKNKYFILGFPSLQPDMYQESILKIEKVKESIGENKINLFAPAYDPFITAQVINDIIENNPKATNVYMSPLSTKPQTIGTALYFLWNYKNKPISIIFPYSKTYATKHAIGIKRTWRYTFEFP